MAEEQQQEEGGFFSNPLVMIGGLLMGALMFFPNLISGLFGAIGSLFSGLMSNTNQQSGSQTASNPLSGLLSMFGLGGSEPAKQTAPAVTPPATTTAPAVTPPATTTTAQPQSNGFTEMFASVVKMFSDGMTSLMGGTANAAQAPKTAATTPATQPTPQNQPTVQQKPAAQGNGFMDMLSGMWKQVTNGLSAMMGGSSGGSKSSNSLANTPASNVVATVHDAAHAKGVTNDRSKPFWCSVNAKGEILAGNCVNDVGDNASITKMLSVRLIASDSKLPAGFLQRSDIKSMVEDMAHHSDNKAADNLLKAVAKESNRDVKGVIKDYNAQLKKMGFGVTQIANFSGLPTKGDGGLFVEPYMNVGTAHEAAVWTQQLGAQYPQIAAIFATKDNQTGMSGVDAQAVKTGTAQGIIATRAGARKSGVAYDGSKGSMAILEAKDGEWIPTITAALNIVDKKGGFPVENSTSVIAQAGGGKTKSSQQAIS